MSADLQIAAPVSAPPCKTLNKLSGTPAFVISCASKTWKQTKFSKLRLIKFYTSNRCQRTWLVQNSIPASDCRCNLPRTCLDWIWNDENFSTTQTTTHNSMLQLRLQCPAALDSYTHNSDHRFHYMANTFLTSQRHWSIQMCQHKKERRQLLR